MIINLCDEHRHRTGSIKINDLCQTPNELITIIHIKITPQLNIINKQARQMSLLLTLKLSVFKKKTTSVQRAINKYKQALINIRADLVLIIEPAIQGMWVNWSQFYPNSADECDELCRNIEKLYVSMDDQLIKLCIKFEKLKKLKRKKKKIKKIKKKLIQNDKILLYKLK